MDWMVGGTTYEWSADWFQAWGSVLAIWFAGRFAIKDRLERRAEAMEAFHGVAREVSRSIHAARLEAEGRLVGGPITKTWGERFDDLEALLKGVSVFDLGATNGATAVTTFLFLVRAMRALMEDTSTHGSPHWIDSIRGHDDEAAALAETIARWRRRRERRARLWFVPQSAV